MTHDPQNARFAAVKRLVLIAQELVNLRRYEDYVDLKADLRDRAARLHLAYDAEMLAEALDRLERGGQLPAVSGASATAEAEESAPVIDPEESLRVLATIRARTNREILPLSMAPASPVSEYNSARARTRERALRFVLDELHASLARDRALAEPR